MARARNGHRWWVALVLVACATLAASTYLWLFRIHAVLGPLAEDRAGDASLTVRGLRTFALFPWLPEIDVLVSSQRGEWRTTMRDAPRRRSGTIEAVAALAVREGALLVRDGNQWRAHELSTGDVVSLASLRPIGGVVPIVTRETASGALTLRGIGVPDGAERWAVEVGRTPCCELPRVASFGRSELVIGRQFHDAATGALRPPIDSFRFGVVGDEVVWIDGLPPAVFRRRAGEPPRRVLDVTLAAAVEGIAIRATTIVAIHRYTAWAPGLARRERPERVRPDEIHARDETVILAFAPDDSVRWALASGGSLVDACELTGGDAIAIGLSFVVPTAFELRWFEIDVATGEVKQATRGCPEHAR